MIRTGLVGAIGALVLLVGIACGGDDSTDATEAATPGGATVTTSTTAATGETPTPAPTVAAELAPEFRDFAAQIDEAVRNKDLDFFIDHAWTERVVCAAADVARQDFFKACETEGQEFQGIGLSVWKVEGGALVPAERALALINSLWEGAVAGGSDDKYGGADAQLYAIGANTRAGYSAQVAVITAQIERPPSMPGTGPLRVAVVTHWRFEEDDWRLFEVMQAVELTDDLLEPTNDGRVYINAWEKYGS